MSHTIIDPDGNERSVTEEEFDAACDRAVEQGTVYLLDLDGVVVKQGTREFLPGAREAVIALTEKHPVFFFSCWAFTADDLNWLQQQFPFAQGCIRKPYAEFNYVFIDDKLDLAASGTSLCPPASNAES